MTHTRHEQCEQSTKCTIGGKVKGRKVCIISSVLRTISIFLALKMAAPSAHKNREKHEMRHVALLMEVEKESLFASPDTYLVYILLMRKRSDLFTPSQTTQIFIMILDNIEITVADCLLNLSRARSSKTLPPKKRFHDLRAYENRQAKRSKMNACEDSQLRNNCKEIISQSFCIGDLTLNSQALPTSTTRAMYPIGQLQTHPFSPFSGYRKECSVGVDGTPCVFNTDAAISTTRKMLEAPVSPGSKTGSESEPIEDIEFEERSRSASVVSDDSIHDLKNIKTSALGTLDAEIEPTCDDVLIGTG